MKFCYDIKYDFNIQWVHKDINKMKLDHSQEYFINICKMVYENVITPDR